MNKNCGAYHIFHFILCKERTSPCTIISHGRSPHSPPAQISFQHPALVTRSSGLLELCIKGPPNIFLNFRISESILHL